MELKQNIPLLGAIVAILLIVPYGIETFVGNLFVGERSTFNRTLWN